MKSLKWKKKRRSELLISDTIPPHTHKKIKIRRNIKSIQFRMLSKASSCLEARDDITLEGDTHPCMLKWKKSLKEEKMSKKTIFMVSLLLI